MLAQLPSWHNFPLEQLPPGTTSQITTSHWHNFPLHTTSLFIQLPYGTTYPWYNFPMAQLTPGTTSLWHNLPLVQLPYGTTYPWYNFPMAQLTPGTTYLGTTSLWHKFLWHNFPRPCSPAPSYACLLSSSWALHPMDETLKRKLRVKCVTGVLA